MHKSDNHFKQMKAAEELAESWEQELQRHVDQYGLTIKRVQDEYVAEVDANLAKDLLTNLEAMANA